MVLICFKNIKILLLCPRFVKGVAGGGGGGAGYTGQHLSLLSSVRPSVIP